MSETMLVMKQLLVNDFNKSGLGLSFEDWINLYQLQKEDSISQNHLANLLGKDKTTISRLIDNWISKGWVTKKKNILDSRIKDLSLSNLGIQLHLKGCDLIINRDKEFNSNFTNKELITFLKLLSKFKNSI